MSSGRHDEKEESLTEYILRALVHRSSGAIDIKALTTATARRELERKEKRRRRGVRLLYVVE